MYEELALYIDGEFRQGSDGAGEDVINPATEEALAFLPHASKRRSGPVRSIPRRKDSRSGATPQPTSAATGALEGRRDSFASVPTPSGAP